MQERCGNLTLTKAYLRRVRRQLRQQTTALPGAGDATLAARAGRQPPRGTMSKAERHASRQAKRRQHTAAWAEAARRQDNPLADELA